MVLTRAGSALTARQLAGFVAGCLLFPVPWLLGNYQMHGDPTYPLAYINDDHRRWAATYEGGWRQLWLRAQGIAFWPAMAFISLTPGVAVLSVAGAMTVWRKRPTARWLVATSIAPLLYYAIRTTVFADFVPLTRYMAVPLTVMLVFVWDGYLSIANARGVIQSRRVVQATIALALAVPLTIGWFTFRRDGPLEDILRPISPTSTNSRAVMAGAEFIRSTVLPGRYRIVVDIDEGFLDLPLVFYGGLLQEHTIRIREAGDLPRVAREQPRFVVRFDRGSLLEQGNVRVFGRTLELGGVTYDELGGFSPPLHVYALRGGPGRSAP
jgi:hypothetical protein